MIALTGLSVTEFLETEDQVLRMALQRTASKVMELQHIRDKNLARMIAGEVARSFGGS